MKALLLALLLAGCATTDDRRREAEDPEEQEWFCEDYLANDERPFPGCIWEGRQAPDRLRRS